ncbi:MAG: PspC domain-containing protein [Rhodothermales bacterium]|nr:PspC domain-containing protein [Rhodothermales bacterium]
MTSTKLTRSSSDKVIAGVCGGIAEYFDMDPTVVRVAYALASLIFAAFPGLIVYVILMILMPQR